MTFLHCAAVQALVYLNHAYEKVRAFPHIGLCSSLQAAVCSMVGRRGALLGLYMMIIQDTYNLPPAICEQGDLCTSPWSSCKAMPVQNTLLWIISRDYWCAEVKTLRSMDDKTTELDMPVRGSPSWSCVRVTKCAFSL